MLASFATWHVLTLFRPPRYHLPKLEGLPNSTIWIYPQNSTYSSKNEREGFFFFFKKTDEHASFHFHGKIFIEINQLKNKFYITFFFGCFIQKIFSIKYGTHPSRLIKLMRTNNFIKNSKYSRHY